MLLKRFKVDYIQFVDIPIERLVRIYNSVDCLVFPSLIEGFGLPIIEAQACHCPVITSNLSSMPEVAGNGAIFVNPFSIDEIKEAIIKIIKDRNLKKRLIKNGVKNINRFKWKDTAQQYYEIYKKICNSVISH
jgi:glycosyltransferase involved in cell wall biosynthesis